MMKMLLVFNSQITDMSGLFKGKRSFDQDISSWDTSNVVTTKEMFYFFDDDYNTTPGSDVGIFNQDISNWDMSNVEDMNGMFTHAIKFNQEIGNWDVSKVKDMSYMFFCDTNKSVRFNKYLVLGCFIC